MRQPKPYKRHGKRRVFQAVLIQDGRKVFRNLCTFAEARLAPDGTTLPDWSDEKRHEFLMTLYFAAARKLADEQARATLDAPPLILATMENWIELTEGVRQPATLALYRGLRDTYRMGMGEHPLWEYRAGTPLRTYSRLRADAFRRHLSTRPAHGVRGKSVKAVRPRLSPNTVRKQLGILRAFLHWCQSRDMLDTVPRFDLPPAEERHPRVLTPEQERDLLARIRAAQASPGERNRRFVRLQERYVMLAMAMGGREGTVWSRRWADFDFGASRLRLGPVAELGFTEKGHSEGWIPLPAEAVAWFRREYEQELRAHPKAIYLLDDGHGRIAVGRYAMTRAMGRWLAAMGLAGQGYQATHLFRRGYITGLHRAKVDLVTIQGLARHKNLTTTRGYLADPDAHQEEAVQRLDEGYRRVTRRLQGA